MLILAMSKKHRDQPHEHSRKFNGWPSNRIVWVDFQGTQKYIQKAQGLHHWLDVLPDGSALSPASYYKWEGKNRKLSDQVFLIHPENGVTKTWPMQDLEKLVKLDPRSTDPLHLNRAKYYSWNPITGKPILLISFRNVDTIAMMDYESGKIIWHLSGVVSRQHDPSLPSTGEIIVFDNGYEYEPLPFSRLVKIDPRKNEVTKVFQGSTIDNSLKTSFFSPYMGFALLTNKNTVIAIDSGEGNYFEVDEDFKKVNWKGRNPHFSPTRYPGFGQHSKILHASYHEEDLLEKLPLPALEKIALRSTITVCRLLLPGEDYKQTRPQKPFH